jgi:nucleotide-binding universal stress UspA family protein
MSFRTVLVMLDDNPRCDVRVRIAARLATRHDAHLVGVAPTGLPDLTPGLAASRSIDDAATARAKAVHGAGDHVARFHLRCKAEGVASARAHVHEGDKAAVVLHHAHCADLVVISQVAPDDVSHWNQARMVEQVLLRNPRPTLVVPHAGGFDTVGDTVLIAWDDSPGCARAVADALPLLRRARRVHLRVWHRPGEVDEGLIGQRMEDVYQWLVRQGVAADVQVIGTREPIGEAILHKAAGLDADLVVMGTYGHSRWTERIVGGATRTALARSPVPLLMSH